MLQSTQNFKTQQPTYAAINTSIIAWVISIGVHVGLGGLAFLITWTVIQVAEEPPPLVTATWHEQSQHSKQLPSAPLELEQATITLPTLPTPTEKLTRDGLALLNSATPTKIPQFARREKETEAAFMGLEALSAQKLVYVVDASGSMMMHLTTVIQNLEKSLYDLNKKQSFAILFFKNDQVIAVPPINKLMPATSKNIKKALEWIQESDHVTTTGRSNPIKAIKSALRLKPDLVYLLSENIRGAGEYEVSPEQLLASLNILNPIVGRNGRRLVRINCIEFLTRDPANTMLKIAENHGGIDGYTFIDSSKVSR